MTGIDKTCKILWCASLHATVVWHCIYTMWAPRL